MKSSGNCSTYISALMSSEARLVQPLRALISRISTLGGSEIEVRLVQSRMKSLGNFFTFCSVLMSSEIRLEQPLRAP